MATPEVPDGDDSVLASLKHESGVPLFRPVKLGTRGPDALAVKRALATRTFGGWGKLTRLFGPFAVRNLRRWQKHERLHVDGEYGPIAHRRMQQLGGFDDYGRKLMGQVHVKTPALTKRGIIVDTARLSLRHAGSMVYTQGASRMQGVRQHIRPPQIPRFEDCSSWATYCYWVAGVPDPNGLGYSGYGFTGTLAEHGHRVEHPQLGDLIFYGNGPPFHHVAVYSGNGRGIGFGSQGGPRELSIHYRSDFYEYRSYL